MRDAKMAEIVAQNHKHPKQYYWHFREIFSFFKTIVLQKTSFKLISCNQTRSTKFRYIHDKMVPTTSTKTTERDCMALEYQLGFKMATTLLFKT